MNTQFAFPSTWTANSHPNSDAPQFVHTVYPGVHAYITRFLTAKHPFRRGQMCPFVAAALKKDQIYFSYPQSSANSRLNSEDGKSLSLELEACIQNYIELKRESDVNFSAMIVLLPLNFPTAELLKFQRDFKESCVKRHLMIGALYPANPSPSLHHPKYHPLRTPSPVLVLRDLTLADLIFLHPDRYDPSKKIAFLRSYIDRFAQSPRDNAKTQVSRAKKLLLYYQLQQHQGSKRWTWIANIAAYFAALIAASGITYALLR